MDGINNNYIKIKGEIMSRGTQEYKNLEELLEKIKTVNLIERIFSWSSIRKLSYDAYDEFKSIDKITELAVKDAIARLEVDKAILNEQITQLHNKDKENIAKIVRYEKDYDTKTNTLQETINRYDNNISKLEEKQLADQKQRFELMKETWKKHETNVESIIKCICKQNYIDYISKEKIEFKGKPDNTIKIAGQYIIFDAKSPANDDLRNFPTYIKTQATNVEKYIKEKDVKKTIYLVIPQNTIFEIKEYTINVANYKVFIVTPDSLESIILTLKEVENYETLENLSPEDRDKICEVIGRFAHSTKRKIEIDNYMNKVFLDVLDSCNQLDKETKNKSIDYEKSYKLNPNQDRINKTIDVDTLNQEITEIEHRKQLKDQKLLNTKK